MVSNQELDVNYSIFEPNKTTMFAVFLGLNISNFELMSLF